jgi:hypothetical protein
MLKVWADEKCIQNFAWKYLKGKKHSRDLGADAVIIQIFSKHDV